MAQIYRKAPLDRLSSPEQLDRLIVITPPSFWVALVGAALVVLVALTWSFTGRLPVKLEASGILLPKQEMGTPASENGESSGETEEMAVVCYIPLYSGKRVKPGMSVIVSPTTVNEQECGHMEAEVVRVDDYAATAGSMEETLGNEMLVQAFAQSGPVVGITCRLRTDERTSSGYWWSNEKGADVLLPLGTMVEADIIIEWKTPIRMLIPALGETVSFSKESQAENGGTA